MPDYRAYIVGPDGHFQTFKVIKAADDAAAIEAARQFTTESGVEIWELDRQVAVLPFNDK